MQKIKKQTQISFYLESKEQKDKLEKIAKECYITTSQLIRGLVLEILEGRVDPKIIFKIK